MSTSSGRVRGWFSGWALVAALVAVAATVAIGLWLTRDRTHYDGSIELDTPGVYQDPTDSNPVVAGSGLPDVTMSDADGTSHTFAELRGAPAVVNLWFVACAPCARELGYFASVDAELRQAGSQVRIVGIDPFDEADAMSSFAAERGVQYDLWRDTERTLGVALGITAYPVTLYLDADGNVVRQTGETTADELRQNISELFG